jgi:hypothetical protein
MVQTIPQLEGGFHAQRKVARAYGSLGTGLFDYGVAVMFECFLSIILMKKPKNDCRFAKKSPYFPPTGINRLFSGKEFLFESFIHW